MTPGRFQLFRAMVIKNFHCGTTGNYACISSSVSGQSNDDQSITLKVFIDKIADSSLTRVTVLFNNKCKGITV